MPRGRPKLIGPLMPKGGYRTLISKKRLAATAAAYGAMSAAMMSGANKKPRGPNVPVKGSRGRGRPRKVVVDTSTGDVYTSTAPTPPVKRSATTKQLAALAKARAARKPRDYVAMPKGGYRTLTSKKRLAETAAAYAAMSAAMMSGANTGAARLPYGTRVNEIGRIIPLR